MALMVVDFDILMDDDTVSRPIYNKFIVELRRGRTKQQISFDGNRCFISTPEDIYALANRLIGAEILRIDKDVLSIIDVRSKKLFVWGSCNMKIFGEFPNFSIVTLSK